MQAYVTTEGCRMEFLVRLLDDPTAGPCGRCANDVGRGLARTVDALRELPGVGRYTAGAGMSFAHHLDAPILDTNVARLLRRYFGITAAPSARPTHLWQLAAAVIPRGQGYLINQALIDLGALVCTARTPRCVTCPIRRGCAWRQRT